MVAPLTMTDDFYCRTCKRRRPESHFVSFADHERAQPRASISQSPSRIQPKPKPVLRSQPVSVTLPSSWESVETLEDESEEDADAVEEVPTWKLLAGIGIFAGLVLLGVMVLSRLTPPPQFNVYVS